MNKEKLNLRYPLVVEGKYDKITLSSIVQSPILVLNGFGCFRDSEKIALLRRYARSGGLILLTDSDRAGSFLRAKLKGICGGELINLYTPQLSGKEKRKIAPSKDGFLGVEGMDTALLYDLLAPFATGERQEPYLTREGAFEDGLSGGKDSAQLRRLLAQQLLLPQSVTAKALIEAINALVPEQTYRAALQAAKRTLS